MIISEQEKRITSPSDVPEIMSAILNSEHDTDRDREHFWTIGLNTKKNIKYVELVALGSLNAAFVVPREVFRFAIMKGVCSIIICHNHPSGDPEPSSQDIVLTKSLVDAGRILKIEILDHIVLGKPDHYFSFYDMRNEAGFENIKILFQKNEDNCQHHIETISGSPRGRRSPKKNKVEKSTAAAVAQP